MRARRAYPWSMSEARNDHWLLDVHLLSVFLVSGQYYLSLLGRAPQYLQRDGKGTGCGTLGDPIQRIRDVQTTTLPSSLRTLTAWSHAFTFGQYPRLLNGY
ncbi:uncharacterized protein M421DRAFT_279855 [Didymella exigua CBS 183.55]|uniref:Uncharacterized protein n=1 Tax=Didymella exigua CBS 183.55 TaxID=1150837 RepID=A0A6A5R8G5_9PLEO|nr:uncharacterized protein M421DRAFT_279855 [Didymella exigua CBS 183.55]KAF1924501.1 hypothetical protein M421DRAFT_279855 [Didymella exigua CBS 183.55]